MQPAEPKSDKPKRMPKKLVIILASVGATLLLCAILLVIFLPNIRLAEAQYYYDKGEYELCLNILQKHHDTEESFALYKQLLFKICDVGATVYLGSFEQDNNLENGTEDIEWLVLSIDKSTNRALVISKNVLFSSPMTGDNVEENTWEYTTLRAYLNDEFYNSAFDEEAKKRVITGTVKASANPKYLTTETGNNTTDSVFLLSLSEANSYMISTKRQLAIATDYAKANGCNIGDEGYSWWWLRTNGYSEDTYGYVSGNYYLFYDQRVNFGGFDQSYIDGGVRPCIWIQLQQDEGQAIQWTK